MSTGQLQELKLLIKGVVMSSPEGITVNQLQRDFKSMEGHNIPFQKVGYPSLDAFLQSINDTVYVVGSGPCALVGVVKNKKSEHIVNMIQQQKRTKTRHSKRVVRRPLPACNPSMYARNLPVYSNSLNANSLSTNARYAESIQGIINNTRSNIKPEFSSNNSIHAPPQAATPSIHSTPPIIFNFGNQGSAIHSNNFINTGRNVHTPWQPPGSVPNPLVAPVNFNSAASPGFPIHIDSANRPKISFKIHNPNVQKATQITSNYQQERSNFQSVRPKVETNQKPLSFANSQTGRNVDLKHFSISQPPMNPGASFSNLTQKEKPHAEHVQLNDVPEPKNPAKLSDVLTVEKPAPLVTKNTANHDFERCKTLPDVGDGVETNNLSRSFKALHIKQNDLSMPVKDERNSLSISLKTTNIAESISDNSSDDSCKKTQQICKIADDVTANNWETESNATEEAVPKFAVNELIYHLDFPLKTVPFGAKIAEAKLPCEVKIGSRMGIFISEIHSPFHFWFHIHSDNMQLDALMERLDNYYKFLEDDCYCIPPICVLPGQVCATLYCNAWYRAEILAAPKDNKVKVLFLDYGTIWEVNIQHIKYLHTAFAELAVQAHRGCLSHIKPMGLHWCAEGTKRFTSMAFDLMLWARVTDIDETTRVNYLVLCDTNGPEAVQINQALVEAGYSFYDEEWNKNEKPRKRHPREEIPTFGMIESGAYPTLWEINLMYEKRVRYEDIIDAVIFEQDKVNLIEHVLETARKVTENPESFIFKSDLTTPSH